MKRLIVGLFLLIFLATPKYGCNPVQINVGKNIITVIKCTEPPVRRYGCFKVVKAGRVVTLCTEPPIGVN